MTRAIRSAAFLAVFAAGAFVAAGCGSSSSDCNVTPDIATHPSSCPLAPSTTVTVNANWCSCGTSITCDVVNAGGGVFQLEPKVASCDASCPANPSGCPVDAVQCVFDTPAAEGTYHLYFISGSGFEDVTMTVASGQGTTCS